MGKIVLDRSMLTPENEIVMKGCLRMMQSVDIAGMRPPFLSEALATIDVNVSIFVSMMSNQPPDLDHLSRLASDATICIGKIDDYLDSKGVAKAGDMYGSL